MDYPKTVNNKYACKLTQQLGCLMYYLTGSLKHLRLLLNKNLAHLFVKQKPGKKVKPQNKFAYASTLKKDKVYIYQYYKTYEWFIISDISYKIIAVFVCLSFLNKKGLQNKKQQNTM